MKFSLTMKLIAGVTFILVVALAVLERKASGILLGDKVRSLKDQSSQVSYSLSISASEKVKRLDRHLRLILTHSALKTPAEARPRGEDMLLVGTLFRSAGKAWDVHWIVSPEGDKNIDLVAQNFLVTIQKALSIDKVRSDEHHFTRILAADGQPLFAMLIRLSKPGEPLERVAVSVLAASTFFDIVVPFKGSLTTAYVVDKNGHAYAHPNLSLTGAQLKGNPIVDRIVTNFSSTYQGQYEDAGESFIASFDPVPRTNLFAASAISLTKAAAPLSELKWNFAILGIGLLLLAGILAIYISSLLKSPILKLRRVVDDLASGRRPQMEPQSAESEINELASSLSELDKKLRIKEIETQAETHEKIYKEKMSAFTRLSSGLVNELRNPLIGILGHTQLAREKLRDPDSLRRHLDLIEKDVRKTKELVEDISQFSGIEQLDVGSVNLFEAVTSAIEQANRKILPQNISILKNLESVSSANANAVLLRKAFVNVLHACGQLISPESSREIIVRLENDGDDAKISIIFESQAIGRDDLGKIFDPFTKTEGEVELGLDLALAKGILEAHDATVSLENTGQTHFEFVIRLPKVKELPVTETSSPFAQDPGLELKGLNFALPEFSMGESKDEELLTPPEEPFEPQILTKQIMPKVPLENLKIKIRKPTLRV